jgi:hypothetical protein
VRRELTIAIVLLSSACVRRWAASTPGVPSASGAAGPMTGCAPAVSSISSVIMGEEFGRTGASNLYDAIRRLRPAYFATRGLTSIYNEPAVTIVVIANRQVIGGADELRIMGVTGLLCVRRLSAADVYQITGGSAPDGGVELVRGR